MPLETSRAGEGSPLAWPESEVGPDEGSMLLSARLASSAAAWNASRAAIVRSLSVSRSIRAFHWTNLFLTSVSALIEAFSASRTGCAAYAMS